MTWNNPNDDPNQSDDFLNQQMKQGGMPGQTPPPPPDQPPTQPPIYFQTGQPFMVYQQTRRHNMRLMLFIILLSVVLPIVLVVVVLSSVFGAVGDTFGGIGGLIDSVSGPETRAISGNASSFDPITALAEVNGFAGEDAQLTAIYAYYVRSDGTLDLNATYSPAPRVEYEFLREVPRPADAPPVGAGGTTAGQWYEPVTIEAYQPGQVRHVSQTGGGVSLEYNYTNQGLEKQVGSPTTRPSGAVVAPPECSFSQLWQVALKKDAPTDAVAIIEYDESGYDFNISGVVHLRFNADCTLDE